MSRTLAQSLLVLLPTYFAVSVAFAHESWIMRGGHKNAAGEWCCGVGDCFAIPSEQVSVNGSGYRLYGCLLYTSPSPRDGLLSRMPSSA